MVIIPRGLPNTIRTLRSRQLGAFLRYRNIRPGITLTVGILLLWSAASCSHTWGLTDAERCGRLHFPSSTKVLSLEGFRAFQDTSIKLIVDIPSSDLEEFREGSDLPEFSPGIPEQWVNQYWEDSDFASEVLHTDPADSSHIDWSRGPSDDKKIAALGVNEPETRLYITLMC